MDEKQRKATAILMEQIKDALRADPLSTVLRGQGLVDYLTRLAPSVIPSYPCFGVEREIEHTEYAQPRNINAWVSKDYFTPYADPFKEFWNGWKLPQNQKPNMGSGPVIDVKPIEEPAGLLPEGMS